MRMTLVTYRKTYNLGSYQSESIGVEMELNEGDSAVTALDNCSALVDEYHQKTLASLEEYRGTHTRQVEPKSDLSPLDQMKKAINECSSIPVLESFRLLVKNNPELQDCYNEKAKNLSS